MHSRRMSAPRAGSFLSFSLLGSIIGRLAVPGLALVIGAAGCVPDEIGDFVPGDPEPAPGTVPHHLHVTSQLRQPPDYDLRWVAPELVDEVAQYLVYRSTEPMTEDNLADVSPVTVPAAQTSLVVQLVPDSGTQFFRVAAITPGGERLLSVEYSVDTTSRILFRANKDLPDQMELFVALPDGLEPVRISGVVPRGSNISEHFAWSPDATRVAWIADTNQQGVPELFVGRADGLLPPVRVSGATVRDAAVTAFAWSPDARSLAFISDRDRDEVYDLYVVPATGLKPPVKVSGTAPDRGGVYDGVSAFAWSPDGTRLAFTSDDRFDDLPELYVVPESGIGPRRVSNAIPVRDGGSTGVTMFAWSPDGTRLAYLADEDRAGILELHTVVPNGSSAIQVSGSLVAGGSVQDFAWSPASDQLAFLADRRSPGTAEVFTVPAAGGLVLNITGPVAGSGTIVPGLAWSRLGTRLTFAGDKDIPGVVGLYTVAPDGTDETRVTGTSLPNQVVEDDYAFSPDSERIAVRVNRGIRDVTELFAPPIQGGPLLAVNPPLSTGRNIERFAWSADGSRLAYVADEEIDEQFELFVIPATGSLIDRRVSGRMLPDSDVAEIAWSPLSSQ